MRQVRRALARGVIIVLVFTTGGCSLLGLAFDNLEWIAMRYVHQYLDLNDEQDAAFRANLVVTIEAYRKDGLDDIIRTLAVAQAYAADGVTADEIKHLGTEGRKIYRDIVGRLLPLLVLVLPTLGPDQLSHLKAKNTERNENFAQRYGLKATSRERIALRGERMAETLTFWVGELEHSQYLRLDALSARLPDHVEVWQRYRLEQQSILYEHIARRASANEFESLLEEWFLHQGGLGAASYLASTEAQAIVWDIMVEVDRMITASQRQHLLRRLRTLRKELEALANRSV